MKHGRHPSLKAARPRSIIPKKEQQFLLENYRQRPTEEHQTDRCCKPPPLVKFGPDKIGSIVALHTWPPRFLPLPAVSPFPNCIASSVRHYRKSKLCPPGAIEENVECNTDSHLFFYKLPSQDYRYIH